MSEYYIDGFDPEFGRKREISASLQALLVGGLLGKKVVGLDSPDVSVTIPVDTDDTPKRVPGIRKEDVDEAINHLAGALPIDTYLPKKSTYAKFYTVVDGKGKFEPVAVTAKVGESDVAELADWTSYLATRPVAITDGDRQVIRERRFASFGRDIALRSLRNVMNARKDGEWDHIDRGYDGSALAPFVRLSGKTSFKGDYDTTLSKFVKPIGEYPVGLSVDESGYVVYRMPGDLPPEIDTKNFHRESKPLLQKEDLRRTIFKNEELLINPENNQPKGRPEKN